MNDHLDDAAGTLARGLGEDIEEIVRFGSRYLGDPGEQAVRNYIEGKLLESGLSPTVEDFEVVGYTGQGATCEIIGEGALEPCTGLQWTAAGEVEGEAVFIGEPSCQEDVYESARRQDLTGKIVVLQGPWPFATVPTIAECSAAGVVAISGVGDGLLGEYTGQIYPRPVPRLACHALPTPGVVIERQAGVRLLSAMTCRQRVRLRLKHDANYRAVKTANVVASVAGLGSKEYVLITAHTDTQRGTVGAWDNTAGVAALLAIADRWAKQPTFRRVVFVATADEEQGLSGAVEYCRRHRDELGQAVAMLNLDALAWLKGGEVSLHVDDALRDYVLARLDEIDWSPNKIVEPSGVPCADHHPFIDAGVPACWLWRQQPIHPYYHSSGDVASLLDIDAVAANAAAVEYLARNLANENCLNLGRSRPHHRWMRL